MSNLSNLERAVLREIARQVPGHEQAFEAQLDGASVVERENTGAGFFTTLSVASGPPADGLKSPVGDVRAIVTGRKYEMGFQLWLENGLLRTLEGYTYGQDSTTGLDYATVSFSDVGPRV